MQLLINQITQEIICTAIGKGKQHDFQIFKKSAIKAIQRIEVIADKGYQEVSHYHANSRTPQKKPRKGKLTSSQKPDNKNLAKLRIKVEHIIRFLKIFRILSSRYRNRRKRFGLRVNLIAGIYNYELKRAKFP